MVDGKKLFINIYLGKRDGQLVIMTSGGSADVPTFTVIQCVPLQVRYHSSNTAVSGEVTHRQILLLSAEYIDSSLLMFL